jgi:hypothetical protein
VYRREIKHNGNFAVMSFLFFCEINIEFKDIAYFKEEYSTYPCNQCIMSMCGIQTPSEILELCCLLSPKGNVLKECQKKNVDCVNNFYAKLQAEMIVF